MDLLSLVARLTLDSSDYDKGLKGAVSTAGSIASKIGKAASVAVGAATTAVSGFATASVMAGQSFDASMSKVGAISGATGKDFDDLRAKAQEMGAKTKFSATEAADAFSYMAMAGWKTNDMLGGIEGIMNLAAASGEDLATTSDIVTDAMTAFGLSAQDSGHFADVLAAASSNANTNVSMMGETFKYAAPIAGALGFSAEDTAEAIGLMANAGIKGSQAGTSLRMIMNQMSGPIDIAGKALGNVTIQTTKADGTMRDLSDILDDCRAAFDKLTPAEQAQAAESIAGKNAMSGFLAIMNTTDKDLNKLRTSINKCDGAAKDMAETMQDNLAGDVTIFKSSLEGLQIGISDRLTPTLREFVQFGTNGISKITKALQKGNITKAINMAGKVLANGLTMVTKKLPKVVDAGVKLLGSFGNALIKNAPAIGSAAMEIVTMLGEYLVQYGPRMADKAGDLLGMFGQYVLDNLPELVNTALELVENFGGYIADVAPSLIPAAVGMLMNLGKALTNPDAMNRLIDVALSIIKGLATGLINSASVFVQNAPTIIGNLASALLHAASGLIETGKQIIEPLVTGISENVPGIGEAFEAIAGFWEDTLKPALVAMYDYVYRDLIPTLLVWFEYKLQPTIESVFGAIAGFWNDTLKPAFTEIYDYVIGDLIPTMIDWWENHLAPVIEKVFQGIVDFWNNALQPVFDDMKTFIVETLVPKFIELGKAVTGFVDEHLMPLADALLEFMNGDGAAVASWLQDSFVTAWNGIKTVMSDLLTFITSVFSGDWQSAWEALVGMVKAPFDTLGEILKTPINAVIDIINQMLSKVESAINTMINGINSKLHLHFDGVQIGWPINKTVAAFDWSPNLQTIQWGRIQKLAKGGVLGEGQSAFVGEYAPELLRVIGGKAVVTPLSNTPGRFPGGQTVTVPHNTDRPINIVFELDGAQKWVYRLNKLEEQRIGMKLSGDDIL